MAPQLENLSEALQRYLGLQQAQTLHPDDLAADAIARLLNERGDIKTLLGLWDDDRTSDVFETFRPEHEAPRQMLRRVLDAGMVVQRFRGGQPRTLLSLSPRLIASHEANNAYREVGRSVVEGLWSFLSEDTRRGLTQRLRTWENLHPLAQLLAPLCTPIEPPSRSQTSSNLAQVLTTDPHLSEWVRTVCTEDWMAWLRMSETLSVDEQLETMVSLIGLHLHVALLYRLRDLQAAGEAIRPLLFLSLSTKREDVACERAAGTFYGFWRDRSETALDVLAHDLVEKLAQANPLQEEALKPGDWQRVLQWRNVEMIGRTTARTRKAYQEQIDQLVAHPPSSGPASRDEALKAVVRCYAHPFRGPNGVLNRIKEVLRQTGRAAGLVGPDEKHKRKRYQASGRGLELLVRLHVHRGEHIRSSEEEQMSTDALLDDVFARYGLIVTRERDGVRQALRVLQEHTGKLRPLLRMLPDDESMRRNRALLDRRLEEMRLLRRFSDASAVLVVG